MPRYLTAQQLAENSVLTLPSGQSGICCTILKTPFLVFVLGDKNIDPTFRVHQVDKKIGVHNILTKAFFDNQI
jgi:hypothetical protein